MKIKTQTYAKLLVELMSKKKTDAELTKTTNGFLKLLIKNGDVKKAKEVLLLAEKLWLKKNNQRKVILETARVINQKDLIKSFAKKGDIIEEKVDPAIIAGIKIIINSEKQLDFSLKSKLDKIFKTSDTNY